MITSRVISGSGYAARHLRYSDYLDEQNRIQGQWMGLGADRLGLLGQVTDEALERLRRGAHPETGERLRPRMPDESNGRGFYDMVMSSPKSVSVAALVGGDERLLSAVRDAEMSTLAEVERFAQTRVRKGGAHEDRATGNLVCAVFHHDASRSLDPQLHSHFVVGNITYDKVEGRWKALQARAIYDHIPYLTEMYRNELAARVRDLGYQVEASKDKRGRHLGFEITHVQPLNERYSERSRERDAAIAAFVTEHGREPSKNEVAVLVRNSRADKLTEISRSEVQEQQRAKLTAPERTALAWIIGESRTRASLQAPRQKNPRLADEILRHAEEATFERVTVTTTTELLTTSLRFSLGRVSTDDLKAAYQRAAESGRYIIHGTHLTTREALVRERQMIGEVDLSRSSHRPIAKLAATELPPHLSEEQRNAVIGVLSSRDRVVALQGAAGTGKTTVLEHVRAHAERAGYEVLAVAPTVSAVGELSKAGFSNATTLSRLLADKSLHNKAGRLLIVDEAAMVSSKSMHSLLTSPEMTRDRVLLVGDTKQLQSVEAGDAMRLLQRDSRLQTFRLEGVFRQRGALKKAVEQLRHDPRRGFDALVELGAVHQAPPGTTMDAAVDQYLHWSKDSKAKPETILAVAPTWAEINAFTERVREKLLPAGPARQSISVARLAPLNWTLGEKRQTEAFKAGHVLVFNKSTAGVSKNETLTVTGNKKGTIFATKADGQQVRLTGKQAKAFDVFAREVIEVAAGDQLLLQANRRAAPTTAKWARLAAVFGQKPFSAKNGEVVKVASVRLDGRVRLTDGRVIPKDYRQLTHGYAVTTYASQGKTVDRVLVIGEQMSQEHFYVAATRARKEVAIFTPDAKRFAASLTRSSARPTATDVDRAASRGPAAQLTPSVPAPQPSQSRSR